MPPPRPFAVLVFAAAAGSCVAVAGCAGGDGAPRTPAGASSGGPAASPTPGARGPILVSAALEDRDGSGGASAGDVVVLGFDRDIDPSRLAEGALRLLSPVDSMGAGAAFAVCGRREVALTLGAGASLSLYETYRPNPTAANRSPAAISADPGAVFGADGAAGSAGRAVPILLPPALRAKFQPDQHRGPFGPYRGQMHAHTTYSDGSTGVPADAYDMARRRGGLDWFVVTEHVEFFPLDPWKWPANCAQAEAGTIDGTFVALWGYEWGSGLRNPLGPEFYNHVNVLSDRMLDVFAATSLPGFYAQLARLGDDAIAKFNHPWATSTGYRGFLRLNNWEGYRHDAGADRFFRFVSVMHGLSDPAAGYVPLLENGWHVAPGFGEDNHGPDWGLSEMRMGLYAAALTRDTIREAMRARRSFTSSDRDAWVRLAAADPAGELWMGSTVCGPGPVTLVLEGGDPTDGLDGIEVIGPGALPALVAGLGGAGVFRLEWTIDPTDDAYYYMRLVEQDGDVVYSAPIFVDR